MAEPHVYGVPVELIVKAPNAEAAVEIAKHSVKSRSVLEVYAPSRSDSGVPYQLPLARAKALLGQARRKRRGNA